MEKFKFKYAFYHYILLIAGIVLSVGCIIYNIITLASAVSKDLVNSYKIISFSVIVIVCIVAIIVFTSMIISSGYVLGERGVTIQFGIIKTLIEYNKIKQIVLFSSNNKLTVFLTDETFNNIVIRESEYDSFVSALTSKYSKITYYEDLKE